MNKNKFEDGSVSDSDIDKCYTVYMHISPSGRRYIGITRQEPEKRWLNGKGYQNQIFGRAVKKYGWNNIKHEILFRGLTKEEAEQKEIELIAYYESNDCNYGYNIENGGNGRGKMSESTREKMREINKGRFLGRKLTPQWIANRTAAQTGLKRSEETIRKIREANSVKVICINTRVIYNSLTEAEKETDIDIAHISQCCNKQRKSAGRDCNGLPIGWMFYNEYLQCDGDLKTYDELMPKRMKDNMPKKVICLNTCIIYDSLADAAKDMGVFVSGISSCCSGRQKSCGKDENGNPLHWMFYDEYLKVDDLYA